MTHAEVLLNLGFSIYFVTDGYKTTMLIIVGYLTEYKIRLCRHSLQFDLGDETEMLYHLETLPIIMFTNLRHFLKHE